MWKRHRRYSLDGTGDKVQAALLPRTDAAELIAWEVSMDSKINRIHQHGSNMARHAGGNCRITRISSLSPATMRSERPMRHPGKEDQKANRKRKGSAGGRPVSYDKVAYKRRNVFERSYNTLKQWRSLTTRVRLARSRLPNSRRTTSRRQLESRHHRRSP